MALYSLIIAHQAKSYSTQLRSTSARRAVKEYVVRVYPKNRVVAFGEGAPQLSAKDILYVVPMDGLVNLWLACAGRGGRYISIVCARTVARRAA